MAHKLSDEIIDLILSFAPNFHDNLLSCHKEMLTNHRPIYYKKVVAGFAQEQEDWYNFKKNDEIRIWRRGTFNLAGVFMKLKLRAIEISPKEGKERGGEQSMIFIMVGPKWLINISGIH